MSAATTTTESPPRAGRSVPKAFWREALAPYGRPDMKRSLLDVASSIVPYLALWWVMYELLAVSYWLVLAVAIPASGFLVRSFIVFHDCAHGNFLPSKRGNVLLGTLAGLLVFSPFTSWKLDHAAHHASAGDLDRRGAGDVETLTLAEYVALSGRQRLGYRLFRNPLVMFGVGPLWALALEPRLIPFRARTRIRRSHIITDLVLALLVGALCLLIGWKAFLLVQLPLLLLAGAAGVWLFYVQHQFEDVYWERSGEWSYAHAALQGSSYLKLPQPLQFFTGNIGLHHVHHLSPNIPNYNLQRAHDENPFLHVAPTLSLWDGLKSVRLKVYDEERGRLATWAQVRAVRGGTAAST